MENDSGIQAGGFFDSRMSLVVMAKKEVLAREDLKTPEQRINACEKTAVGYSLSNLMMLPWIRERVDTGTLSQWVVIMICETATLLCLMK
jgi:hypothetical protein